MIIAGAGGAAHLPGMVAAQTVLPVIGVPVQSAALNGLDSLLSIVQMPKGVPVATVAIGAAGAANAGLLAVAILAHVAARAARAAAGLPRRDCRRGPPRLAVVTAPRRFSRARPSASSAAASSAACSRWPRGASATASTRSRPSTTRPPARSPTSRSSASYDDLDAVRAFARGVDVVTFEFENVSGGGRGGGRSARDRPAERPRARDRAAPPPREDVSRRPRPAGDAVRARSRSDADLPPALEQVGCPAVLKTAAFGYDGKGQVRDRRRPTIRRRLGRARPAAKRSSKRSSISSARSRSSARAAWTATWSHFAPIENVHRHHILDVSVAPADVPRGDRGAGRRRDARACSRRSTTSASCASSSSSTRDGRLLINELAPRPHNSGHLTFDACRTSQFEQQLRAICGLPLGSPELLQPAAMANLLGDLWAGGEPRLGGGARLSRTSSCTCTASRRRGPGGRWAT